MYFNAQKSINKVNFCFRVFTGSAFLFLNNYTVDIKFDLNRFVLLKDNYVRQKFEYATQNRIDFLPFNVPHKVCPKRNDFVNLFLKIKDFFKILNNFFVSTIGKSTGFIKGLMLDLSSKIDNYTDLLFKFSITYFAINFGKLIYNTGMFYRDFNLYNNFNSSRYFLSKLNNPFVRVICLSYLNAFNFLSNSFDSSKKMMSYGRFIQIFGERYFPEYKNEFLRKNREMIGFVYSPVDSVTRTIASVNNFQREKNRHLFRWGFDFYQEKLRILNVRKIERDIFNR